MQHWKIGVACMGCLPGGWASEDALRALDHCIQVHLMFNLINVSFPRLPGQETANQSHIRMKPQIDIATCKSGVVGLIISVV